MTSSAFNLPQRATSIVLWEAPHWVRKTKFLDFLGVISTPTSPTHSQDNPPVVWSVRERPGALGAVGAQSPLHTLPRLAIHICGVCLCG